ncbi:hypothetical protein NT239_01840 [Chitinibacter sp. SCUT-21]|uniref:hypothetical protein n=1 Tax=Chitinibacter sp. SCUT-21 TaxID=2970891 RepID=UPI0035A6D963
MRLTREIVFCCVCAFGMLYLCAKVLVSSFDLMVTNGPEKICSQQVELHCTLDSLKWQREKGKTVAHTTVSAPARLHADVKAAFMLTASKAESDLFVPSFGMDLVLIDSEPQPVEVVTPKKKAKRGAKNV